MPDASATRVIIASVVWNVVIAVVGIAVSLALFNLTEAGSGSTSQFAQQLLRLGTPVQNFVAFLALLPAALAAYSTVQLLRRQLSGRYSALVIQFVSLVLSIVALLHLWGFFLAFEGIVDGIMRNVWLALGFAAAYAIYWTANRFDERSPLRDTLTQLAYIVGMITLVVVLLAMNVLDAASDVLSVYDAPFRQALMLTDLNLWLPWIFTASVVITAILTWNMLKLGEYFGERQDQIAAWQGWLMLSPNILGFAIFFAGPLLLSFYLSFTDSKVGQVPNFLGLQNYSDILALEVQWKDDLSAPDQSVMTFGYTPLGAVQLGERALVVGAKDTLFWLSMRNTFLFCLLLLPLSVLPALGLALILNSKLPGVTFFRAVYFLPSVAAVVGTALIWRWLYDPTIGFINYGITGVVNFLRSLGVNVTDPEIAWLTGPSTVLFSIVLLSAWQVVGFNTVLYLAGLQGIPRELYEAASVDGANRWRRFLNVTVPMLAPTTFFVITTTIITGLQVFNEPYALFPSRPLPENAITSVFYLYNQGFFRFNFGYASAIAWILFVVIFLITLLQRRLSSSNAYEG